MTDLIDDTSPDLRPPLPRIVSVDDHVVEPAHLWRTWLPQRFQRAGPKVERRGVGEGAHRWRHLRADVRRRAEADCWVYEDLIYITSATWPPSASTVTT